MAQSNPNRAQSENPAGTPGIPHGRTAGGPGSASLDHPLDGIPLPDHGFETLDPAEDGIAPVPAVDAVSAAAVTLMSATAEKLGLAPGEEPDIDLDQARLLITALAGLLAASLAELGPHREPLHEGLRTLQRAFREASAHPDAPGQGPGEALLA